MWIELRPGPSVDVLDPVELGRIDDWLALAQVLDTHDPGQLASLGFRHDRLLLIRIAEALAAGRLVGDGTLTRTVLQRIAALCPELAAHTGAVIHADGVRRSAGGAERWWTPSDISEPPSDELVAEPEPDLARVDVRRVLDDL